MHRLDFGHHRFIDGEAAGRIDNQDVVKVRLGPLLCGERNIDGFLRDIARKKINADLRGECFQLLDGGRAVNVHADDQNFLLVAFFEKFGEFARAGGFARALQTGQQNDRGRRGVQIDRQRIQHKRARRFVAGGIGGTHQRDQFAMHNADEGLPGCQGLHDVRAERFFFHAGDEFLDDRQADIRFQQRHPHFAQRVGDVVFGKARLAAQRLDDAGEAIGQIIEHVFSRGGKSGFAA